MESSSKKTSRIATARWQMQSYVGARSWSEWMGGHGTALRPGGMTKYCCAAVARTEITDQLRFPFSLYCSLARQLLFKTPSRGCITGTRSRVVVLVGAVGCSCFTRRLTRARFSYPLVCVPFTYYLFMSRTHLLGAWDVEWVSGWVSGMGVATAACLTLVRLP